MAKYIRDQYLEWPLKLVETYKAGLEGLDEPLDLESKRTIIGCGMGGSGFSLYAIKPLLEDKPYIVERSDTLPSFASSNDLVLGVSYSGETYETVSCIKQALKRHIEVAGVAGENSTLARLLSMNGKVVEVEKDGFPRSSLASLAGGLAALIGGRGLEGEIQRASSVLNTKTASNIAGEVAENLYNNGDPYIPIVASCGTYGFVAERWITELAENAKHPGLLEIFPEAAHNRIARWSHSRGHYYTLYIDMGGGRLCNLIKEHVTRAYSVLGPVKVLEFADIIGESRLGGILYAALVAGLASVRLAELLGRDPEKIQAIDDYKRSVVGRLTG